MYKVMFLCTGNSCRSQMAEGFARVLGQGRIEAHSAGLMAAGVHPRAIAVMQEAGIDISGQRSREIDQGLLGNMDLAITLCDHAAEACPRPRRPYSGSTGPSGTPWARPGPRKRSCGSSGARGTRYGTG